MNRSKLSSGFQALLIMLVILFQPTLGICAAEKTAPPCLAIQSSAQGEKSLVLLSNGRQASLYKASNIKTPAFSQDLRTVFFSCDSSGSMEIWGLNLETREARKITSHGNAFQALFPFSDPGGNYLVYSLAKQSRPSDPGPEIDPNFSSSSLWCVSLVSGRVQQLLAPSEAPDQGPVKRFTQPRISPDGQSLLFTRSTLPFKGARSFDSMEIMISRLAQDSQGMPRAETPELVAGGGSGYGPNGESLGFMALSPCPSQDGSVLFLAIEGRTDTSIMKWHQGKTTLVFQGGDEILTLPSSRGENIIIAAIGEQGRRWYLYSLPGGQRIEIADSAMEYVGF